MIRAFTYFSHLANLAEDRHHIRRRTIRERAGDTQEGSIEVALARLRWAGISSQQVAQTLASSYVAPVLTAHPTEVQRKSILDAERDIAQLLTVRDDIAERAQIYNAARDALTPRALAANEAQLRARVAQLWQTRLLRYSKLTVADEIENALSYYEATFLREIPRSTQSSSVSWATSLCTVFCAWASGSAATATATPMSAPTHWRRRCAARARWRCATI